MQVIGTFKKQHNIWLVLLHEFFKRLCPVPVCTYAKTRRMLCYRNKLDVWHATIIVTHNCQSDVFHKGITHKQSLVAVRRGLEKILLLAAFARFLFPLFSALPLREETLAVASAEL